MCVLCDQAADADMLSEVDLMGQVCQPRFLGTRHCPTGPSGGIEGRLFVPLPGDFLLSRQAKGFSFFLGRLEGSLSSSALFLCGAAALSRLFTRLGSAALLPPLVCARGSRSPSGSLGVDGTGKYRSASGLALSRQQRGVSAPARAFRWSGERSASS
ncbi:hypothetical protein HPB50_011435 [Hyalomma asiaticum]|uniref:Uncharacterized protein n=1 Tax=Hyalomma asiaticum TaxID=266040 RepID=A0ACB7SQ34_HYAAI|nr:hypothetical protein HPB50_011435 [Hyalomma asiaticum]